MEPNLERVAEKKGPTRRTRLFRPVPGDVEICTHLCEYRLLQRDHLSALTGRDPKRIHRRIDKLLENAYLKRIRLPLAKHIYYLGPAAIPVLLAHGAIDERDIKRRREHELKDPEFLEHELMISTIHIICTLATRASEVKLVSWRQGKEELADTIADRYGTRSICPDAFFILEHTGFPTADGRRPQRGFFLEADRSSMSRMGQMGEKYERYRDYISANLHERKYGIKSVRIVTITPTRARAASLCALVAETLPRDLQKFFRFATLEDFSLEAPNLFLGSAFIHPYDYRDSKRYELLPPPRPFTESPRRG
jgi:hypothetical protein